MSKWISVKDRLPENNSRILAWSDGSLYDSFFMGDNFILLGYSSHHKKQIMGNLYMKKEFILRDISHWMPLPEPPE